MRELPEGWIETELEGIADVIDSLHKTPTYSNDGFPMVRVTDIKRGYLKTSDCFRVDNEVFKEFSKKHMPEKYDIVFSRVGSEGIAALVHENKTFCLGQNTVFITPKEKSSFLYYWLGSSDAREEINARTTGSTQRTISMKSIKALRIALPPLPEQKAIADMLSSFDEKVELLREQNKTLETLAQTIFKEWFVHFNFPDPNGKPYCNNGGEMVESELGLIPQDWRVGKLSEVAEFLNGLALQKYPPINGKETLPAIKIRELKQGITPVTDRVNTELDKKYMIDNGDILFSWSGSLEVVIWKYGKGALNQHLFKVSSEDYSKWFYYYWTLYHLKWFRSIAADKATTMGHIQRKHLDEAKVLIPNDDIMEQGTALFEPIIEKVIVTNEQIQTLSKTRDTLLPKLMCGQVKVQGVHDDS